MQARTPVPLARRLRPAHAVSGTVVVTGGGAGIGRATAWDLEDRGAVDVIGGIDVANAAEAAREVGARPRCHRPTGRHPCSGQVERDVGPLGVLINTAGVVPLGRLSEEDCATTERILQVNLPGVIHAPGAQIIAVLILGISLPSFGWIFSLFGSPGSSTNDP